MTIIWWLQSLLGLLVCSQTVFADAAADQPSYRLPADEVTPSNYKLELTLHNDTFTTNNYTGKVTITLAVKKNLTEIKLHAKGLQIHDAKEVTIVSTDPAANISAAAKSGPTSDPDIYSVTFETALTKDKVYLLTIPFDGILDTKEMDGFYKSSYKNNGQDEFLATTQFESTAARRAFPCFDEPALKATFDLTLTYPTRYTAISNTPATKKPSQANGLDTVTFKQTPVMSTYLLAFIISKFECNKDAAADTYDVVCARPGEKGKNTIQLASEVPTKILPVMQDFTGFNYSASNIGKLTQVAIPDFAAGAMENWGLLTFREADLLWDPNDSSDLYRSRIITVVTHEISHQWFGDLVTPKWWSDIFLNEGFATYFEYHAADQVDDYKKYELSNRFVIEEVQNALADDVDEDHVALHHDVYTPDEISNRFDSVSYDKGGSVLRMLQHIVGLDNFKKGLRKYIGDNKNGNTEPGNLWNAFDISDIKAPNTTNNISAIMSNWINQNGYPLVKAELKNQTVTLSQRHFQIGDDKKTELFWTIPISYITAAEPTINTEPKVWIAGNVTATIPLPANDSWLILNVQQTGYFRVDYDSELWKRITNFLKTDKIKTVPELNRAQIADDLFNLAKAGVRSYSETLNLLAFLKNDDSYYTWYSALNGFDYLLRRVAGDKQVTEALTKYILNAMSPILQANTSALIDSTLSEKFITVQKLNLALTWACSFNNKVCVDYAVEKFQNYYVNATLNKPHRNIRNVVYCNAIKNSKNISADWNFLLEQFKATTLSTEQVTILKALGCAKDHKTIEDYLNLAIADDSPIRNQDATYAFSSSYQVNQENVDVVLDFILKNNEKMLSHFNSNKNLISAIKGIAGRLTRADQVKKLDDFGKNATTAPEVKKAITSAIGKANKNLAVATKLNQDLINFFNIKKNNNTADMNVVHFVALLPTIVLLISMYYR